MTVKSQFDFKLLGANAPSVLASAEQSVVAADAGAAEKPQKVADAVDVFVGGKAGPASRTPLRFWEMSLATNCHGFLNN